MTGSCVDGSAILLTAGFAGTAQPLSVSVPPGKVTVATLKKPPPFSVHRRPEAGTGSTLDVAVTT